jgi:cellulose biosynthesis protein BcsQ
VSVPVVGVLGLRVGTGKTTLIYHLAWMFSELGIRTVVVDLDPQCTLTEHFFGSELTDMMLDEEQSILSGLVRWTGEGGHFDRPPVHLLNDRIALMGGDIRLFGVFDALAEAWRESLDRQPRAVRTVTALHRLIQGAAMDHQAQVVLVDLDPSISPLNRMAFVAITHFLVPVVPEPLSLRSLGVLGATLTLWEEEWRERRLAALTSADDIPERSMVPLGYVVMRVPAFGGRPAWISKRSLAWLPPRFYEDVLRAQAGQPPADVDNDPMCLAQIPRYPTIFQMAAELNKPVFDLKPADGAMGSIMTAVQRARQDFEHLARAILSRVGILPP